MDFRYREILTGDAAWPVSAENCARRNRHDAPHGKKQKRSLTEAAFMRAERGEYGQAVKEEAKSLCSGSLFLPP